MSEKKEYEFHIREDVQETLDEGERILRQRAAERKVREDKKYSLMLSGQTMLIVALVGGLAVLVMIGNGFHDWKLMNDRAACVDWILAAIFAIVAIAWIARSIVLQKQFQEELEACASSDHWENDVDRGPEKEVKKAEEVYVRYKIETFERLSEEEMDQADEEWDEYLLQCTDRFYRMNKMIQPFRGELYEVYVELRYQQLGDMNMSLLSELDDDVYDRMKELDSRFTEASAAFQDGVKELVRKVLAERFPNFCVDEICVAVRKIS